MEFMREAIKPADLSGNIVESDEDFENMDLFDESQTNITEQVKPVPGSSEQSVPKLSHQDVTVPIENSLEDLNFFKTLLPYTCKIPDDKNLSFRTSMNNLVERYIFENGTNQELIKKFRKNVGNIEEINENPDLAFFRTLIDFTTRVKGSKKLRMRINMTEVVLQYASLDNDVKIEKEYSSDDGSYVIYIKTFSY